MTYTDAQIAQVCHEANRTLQTLHVTMGDKSVPVSPPWWSLSEPDREGIIAGVRGVIEGKKPEQSHEAWCDHKRALGWKYGLVKNETTKTHPCLLPYDQLPTEQRRKDHLFAAIVRVLVCAVDAAEVIERWDREASKVHPGTGTPMQAVEQPADGSWSTTLISQPPRIGDRVHYVAHGTPVRPDGSQAFPAACRAAVVTEVLPIHRVGLFVMNPTGCFFNEADGDTGLYLGEQTQLCHGKQYGGGTWHRPAGA